MASSSLGDRKQVQDARFDNHLTGVKKESFYWLTKTIAAHYKGLIQLAFQWKSEIKKHMRQVYSAVNTKSTVSFSSQMYNAEVIWNLDTLPLKSLPSFILWSVKKHCKWQRSLSIWSGAGTFVNFIVEGIGHFSFAERLESLPVHSSLLNCDLR